MLAGDPNPNPDTITNPDTNPNPNQVLAGEAHPLEFRWFVGRHTSLSTRGGEWRSLACARPLLLKRCQALPKPFWHELMELCGGECAELSRLIARENEGSNKRGFGRAEGV